MIQQYRHMLFFFLIALISYGAWKYIFDREPEKEVVPFTKGYSVDNVELQLTDESGLFAAKFISPSLIRYTDSEIVHIQTPNFWTYRNGIKNWMYRSQTADFDYKKNWVNLVDNVSAKSLNEKDQVQFRSNDLLLDLNKKIANTKNGIQVDKNSLNMVGDHAQFDLTSENIEVNGNVKVIYKAGN